MNSELRSTIAARQERLSNYRKHPRRGLGTKFSFVRKARNVSSLATGWGRETYLAARRLSACGRLDAAEAALRKIFTHHLRQFDSLLLLSAISIQEDRPKSAAVLSRMAVALNPNSPAAHHSLGLAFTKQRRHGEAERCFRRALSLDPCFVEAELDLGHMLHERGDIDQAIRRFRHAITIEPALAEAHYRLGNALSDQGWIAAAIACYHRATVLKPDLFAAHSNRAFTMNYDPAASPAELYAAHRACAALFPSSGRFNHTHANDRNPGRRLRIGYVSGDFCEHAFSYFFEPLIASHDRSEIEVFCYSSLDEANEDETTARLKSFADHWTSIFRRDDKRVAANIREDRIDILVDLGGYTARSRVEVFALKPAPVQASWLGYLNTTGLPAMDYRITDAIADPEGEADRFNSEILVRLRPPFLCYRPLDAAPPVSALPMQSAGNLTFGSFNNLPKLTPRTIRLWAELLHAVEGSRLVIKTMQMRDFSTADELRNRFAQEGIGPERLDLLAWRVRAVHHLARYNLVDIALDPFPFNGVTTTCEALWMGVPVVTLVGDRQYGRVGASLLKAVGLEELIAESPDGYLRIATDLACNPDRLKALRATLRDRMWASPLCDGAGFAHVMEQAYRRMWRRWCEKRVLI